MKKDRVFWVNCIFIIALLISGCGSTRATITQTLKETESTAIPNKQPTSTVQPTQATITPTLSPTIRPISTSTFTPAPTTTPTLRPTLEAEQVRETIEAYLHDGGNCETPCFPGILPGKTTLGEALDTLTHLGLSVQKLTDQVKDFYDTHYDFDNGLSISVSLAVRDEIVESMSIDITPERQKGEVMRAWSAFSPDTLIKRYGLPSRVDVAVDWGPGLFFDMDMYFDEVSLIVEYSATDNYRGTNLVSDPINGVLQVCPLTVQFDFVRLWMGKNPKDPPGKGVPLESVTTLSLEEFSELLTGNPDQACFTVDGNVFK